VEGECAKLYDGLKDMAIQWDKKFNDLALQIQHLHDDVPAQTKSLNTTVVSFPDEDIAEKVRTISTQMVQLQHVIRRHMDYNRRSNGERLVTKRENEIQIQSIRKTIARLARVVLKQGDQLSAIHPVNSTTARILADSETTVEPIEKIVPEEAGSQQPTQTYVDEEIADETKNEEEEERDESAADEVKEEQQQEE
jgi:hypothetical protein